MSRDWPEIAGAFSIRSQRVVLPEHRRPVPAEITIIAGSIWSVTLGEQHSPKAIDFGNHLILPGLVDTHVHINDPSGGSRINWEGWESATKSAAAGGITTVIDMPLNSTPVTTNSKALLAKFDAAEHSAFIDYGLWAGIVPGNADHIEPLLDAGARGFKCFMVHSGIDDFPAVGEQDLRRAMHIIAGRHSVLLAHAELPGPIDTAASTCGMREHPRSYAAYLASRPPAAETTAVEMLFRLVRETGCRTHIVHVAAAEVLPILEAARAEGLPITAETCPHYLTLCAEEIPDGATQFKCAPPIRSAANREQLWDGLRAGTLDLIASDHSPCPPALKQLETGDFSRAWGGIASLQLGLPLIWTEATKRGFTITDIARWMSTAPANLAGLQHFKGEISPSAHADLTIFDPDAEFTVDPTKLFHRHPITPYAGRTLRGKVTATFLRGQCIYKDGNFPTKNAGESLLLSR